MIESSEVVTATTVAPVGGGRRRASYGPTSPEVGVRGARTRDRVVSETLALFTQQGFQETTVQDIAAAADVSRATLYQYFESKDEIFVELLDECGGALIEVARGLGALGPTAEGFAELQRWIVAWSEVYERYGTLFVQWANLDQADAGVRPMVIDFSRSYTARIAAHLDECGVTNPSAVDAALVVTSIVHRYNYLRFASPGQHLPVQEAVRDVATVVQVVLFPQTPWEVLTDDPRPHRPERPGGSLRRRGTTSRAITKVEGLSARSIATVRKVLQAGAKCFSESGYHRSNVDDIVRQAGFARGTFYKYFSEKLDLLLTLSDQCEDELFELSARFATIPPGPDGAEQRRAWLLEFLEFRTAYIGVLRTWIDRTPDDPYLAKTRQRLNEVVAGALQLLVRQGPMVELVTIRAAEITLTGVLERLPDAMAEEDPDVSLEEVADLIAITIERALFGVGLQHSA